MVENDTAKYVEVTTGLTGNGITEVLTGLEGGEQLVTVGQAYLIDGDVVRIVGEGTEQETVVDETDETAGEAVDDAAGETAEDVPAEEVNQEAQPSGAEG